MIDKDQSKSVPNLCVSAFTMLPLEESSCYRSCTCLNVDFPSAKVYTTEYIEIFSLYYLMNI